MVDISSVKFIFPFFVAHFHKDFLLFSLLTVSVLMLRFGIFFIDASIGHSIPQSLVLRIFLVVVLCEAFHWWQSEVSSLSDKS